MASDDQPGATTIAVLSVPDIILTRWQPDRLTLLASGSGLWKAALPHREDRDLLGLAVERWNAVKAEAAALPNILLATEEEEPRVEAAQQRRDQVRRRTFEILHEFCWARALSLDFEVRPLAVRLPARRRQAARLAKLGREVFVPIAWLRKQRLADLRHNYVLQPDEHPALMAHVADIERAHLARTALG